MPQDIDRDGLRTLVEDEGAQLVEVLPEPEYERAHLPGALHLPLEDLSPGLAEDLLDDRRPIIAYCNDFL